MVDLIEPSEILVDPIELMDLSPVERPKVDLNDSTHTYWHHIFSQKPRILGKEKGMALPHLWFWQASVVHEDSRLEFLAHGRKPSTSEPEHLVVKFL